MLPRDEPEWIITRREDFGVGGTRITFRFTDGWTKAVVFRQNTVITDELMAKTAASLRDERRETGRTALGR